jgi:YVTN family beta-propeller protein
MRLLICILFWFGAEIFGGLRLTAEEYVLVQNKPVQTGTTVTFRITAPEGSEPYIAWDFGDGSGAGRYKKGLTASFKFNEPGVYQVFARIQGEEIPLTVIQTVYKPLQNPAPSHSTTITIDTATKKIWAVNADNHSVSCIDAVNNKLLKEIPAGKHPRTVALDSSGNAWIANEDNATVSVISGNGQHLNTIKLPYASRPYGICFDPLKKYCYVTLQGTGKLLKLNPATSKIINSVDVGRCPRGIAVTSDGQRIFVTQFISPEINGLVREIDATTLAVKGEIELAYDQAVDFEDRGRGVPNFISSLTITPDGSEIWVPSKKDNTARGLFRDSLALTFDNTVRTIVSKINLVTGIEDIDSRVDINDADLACAVEFSPYGNIAFVALQGNNKITMLETATNSRLGILDSAGLAPQGMVFNADGSRLFVHNFMSRSITVFNTENIILSNNFLPVKVTDIPTLLKDSLDPQVLKGKQIFYNAADERMTFAGYISCASCHLDGGSDERVWDFTDRGEGFRNTHSLLGRRGTGMGNVHWTSNFDEIQDFENDMRNGFKGKGFLPDSVFYSGTISDPLGDRKAGLSQELDALAAYVNSLNKVHSSPYRNEDGTLTADAVNGKIIFAELECGSCHAGPDFTDRKTGLLHDVGTVQPSSGRRRAGTLPGFGTPTLKGIWETAPYLHDGSAYTLRDVLVTKNKDGKHGNLSGLPESQIDQLIAYLLQIDENETQNIPLGSLNPVFKLAPLLVSPNPGTDKVNVQLPEAGRRSSRITIFHTTGQVLYSRDVTGLKEVNVDVSDFMPGIYFVDYSDGVIKSSTKLVVR